MKVDSFNDFWGGGGVHLHSVAPRSRPDTGAHGKAFQIIDITWITPAASPQEVHPAFSCSKEKDMADNTAAAPRRPRAAGISDAFIGQLSLKTTNDH